MLRIAATGCCCKDNEPKLISERIFSARPRLLKGLPIDILRSICVPQHVRSEPNKVSRRYSRYTTRFEPRARSQHLPTSSRELPVGHSECIVRRFAQAAENIKARTESQHHFFPAHSDSSILSLVSSPSPSFLVRLITVVAAVCGSHELAN